MRIQNIRNNYQQYKSQSKPAFMAVKVSEINKFTHPMEVLALAKAIKGGVKELANDVDVKFYPYVKNNRLQRLGVQVYNILPENCTIEDRVDMIDTMQQSGIEIVGGRFTPNRILHKVMELKQKKTGKEISLPDIPGGDKQPEEWDVDIIQAYKLLEETIKPD